MPEEKQILFKSYLPIAAFAVSLMAATLSIYANYSLLHPKLVSFLSVDFEQAYYDARSANLKVDAGKWIERKAEEICEKERCVILQGRNVLGGNVVDMNELFRKQFSISKPAKKPMENTEQLLQIIQGLDASKNTTKK